MDRNRTRPIIWVLYILGVFSVIATGHAQTFSISASPASLTIFPGQQNVLVTVTASSSSYTGPISVTLSGLPSGVTVTPVTLTAGGSGTLKISASVAAGQEGFPPTVLGPTTSWTASAALVGAAGSTQATSPFAVTISISNPAYAPPAASIDLPIVTINTSGTPVVDTVTEVPGTITITSADGQTSYLPNSSDTDNTATFKVHGQTTAVMPKLPYKVKLNTSLDLLGAMGMKCPYVTSSGKAICDKSKSYILLANYDDKTFLRDWTASALANAIPIGNGYLDSPADSPTPSGTDALMPWAPHSLFVEVYLNGVYEGNYQLIEEVKIDSHRVNINELAETDTSAKQVTGGYLMEIDQKAATDMNYQYTFTTPIADMLIGLDDPDFSPDPAIPEQTNYITNYVDNAETALYALDFTDPLLGWRAYFDEASAVNYYIVNDLMGNTDGGLLYSSVYLYKDKGNPLIYMGPIWDFDISAGNVNYLDIVNPTIPWMQPYGRWYAEWFHDPNFKADVATQWNNLKNNGVFSAWLASIPAEAKTLEQSQANNFGRWPMQGLKVWPNSEAVGSYDGEVTNLVEWLNLRFAYLDSVFNGRTQTTTTLNPLTGTPISGSPVTLTAQVTGGASPTGTISFLSNGILLGSSALGGGGTATLTVNNLSPGALQLEAVYSGDSHNALSTSAVVASTVSPAMVATVTSIAGPVIAGPPASATFTASVISSSGTVPPTGTLAFTQNGAAIGTATLASTGIASFSAPASPVAGSVQATYSGDANYLGSTSNVIIPTADFTLAASPAEISVTSKMPGTFQVTLTPIYGYSKAISLSCSGAGPISCSFSPSTVTLAGAPISSTLTVSKTPNQASASNSWLPIGSKAAGVVVAALLFWPVRKRKVRAFLAVLAVLAGSFLVTSCSGTDRAGTYLVTINASSGGITHTFSTIVDVK